MRAVSRREWLRISSAAAACCAWPRLPAQGEELAGGKELVVRTPSPFNAEPQLSHLPASRITPVKHFYVRNHGPLPVVQADQYRVRIEGMVRKPLELSVEEIKARFKPQQVEATLTCAGNRRQEMSAIRAVGGVQWDAGAIGNADWGGASLAQVLAAAEPEPQARHVWFDGLDSIPEKDGSQAPFGGSIPLARAMSDGGKLPPVLLAYSMNDQPLVPAHGFPLRTIVPGFVGARSVKWLAKITVSDRPSPNHYVAEAYKLVKTDSTAELAAAEPIYEFPINAAICVPAPGGRVKAGQVAVAGYALPPGDGTAEVAQVELSADGGQSWQEAELTTAASQGCWRLWKLEISLAPGKHQLVVRATDSRGNRQPEKTPWNLKGYLYNGWHRCSVEVT